MVLTLNRRTYNKLIDENIEWLLQQPRTLERDHIELILRAEIRGRKVCPKCGFKDGEMLTADIDWCPSCHYQWPGGSEQAVSGSVLSAEQQERVRQILRAEKA